MDRRRTVETFRERLTQVIERSGLSRSAFAAKAGLDRSTLSQLLAAANDRLPRAETIAAIAEQEQVSTDWLLGLVQEEKIGTNILSEAPEIARGASSYSDERLTRWRAEAVGYKIRYVPPPRPGSAPPRCCTCWRPPLTSCRGPRPSPPAPSRSRSRPAGCWAWCRKRRSARTSSARRRRSPAAPRPIPTSG